MRYLLTLLTLCTCLAVATAQKGFELGGKVGVGHYFGDLNTDFALTDFGLSGGAIARYNLSTRWSLRGSADYVRVAASDADSRNAYERARNLSFESHVFDGALGIEFNFMNYVHGSRDEFWTPYVFGSLLVSNFQPTAELDGVEYKLRDLGTEGQLPGDEYFTTALGVSYGIGVKVDLSYEWSLNFEFHARQLFADYLDDVSTVYPDAEALGQQRGSAAVALSDRSVLIDGVNTELVGEEGRFRGNASDNDQYAALTVGLVYYFGDIRCPDFGGK